MQMQAQLVRPTSARPVVNPLRSRRTSRLTVLSATQTAVRTTKKEAIKEARGEVRELIKSRHCHPILVRIAWHDSGTYDQVSLLKSSSTACVWPGRAFGKAALVSVSVSLLLQHDCRRSSNTT